MSYTTVVNQIDIILKTATGVIASTVYKYERHTKSWAEYISSFKDTNNVIHGYIITRTDIDEEAEAPRTNRAISIWLIRCFYALSSNGATENTTFQPLIDKIREKFRENPRLNNTVYTTNAIRVSSITPLMFGDVLCHYAEIRIETEEEVTY